MNWPQSAILVLCLLNFILLLALFGKVKGRVVAPATPLAPRTPAEGPATKEPEPIPSVILLTPERDARILDGEEE